MRLLSIMICLNLMFAAGLPLPVSAAQNVVIVVDDSGSMDESMRTQRGRMRRIDAAKQALTQVLSKLPEATNVGVLALNTRLNGSNWIVPLGALDADQWQARVRELDARGGTPLGEFLKAGADELLALREKEVYGTYRLLVITDGEANDQNLVDAYLPDLLSRGIQLDVIGVDMQGDHSLATRAHSYRRADDDSSLTRAISEVFAETSPDNQDAADEFDMLAGLPDEFATQAVQTLTRRNNEPIGPSAWNSEFDTPTASRSAPIGNNGNVSEPLSLFLGLVCCLSPFVALAGVVGVFILLLRRR